MRKRKTAAKFGTKKASTGQRMQQKEHMIPNERFLFIKNAEPERLQIIKWEGVGRGKEKCKGKKASRMELRL
jgi:hypothetical protein